MKYCPECQSNLKSKPIDDVVRLACTLCDYVFWNNPVPVAGSVLINNDDLVLVRPKYIPKGKWSLPAGYIECGESAEEAAVREIKEETNLIAKIESFIGSYPIIRSEKSLLYLAYFAKVIDGIPSPSAEIAEVTTMSPELAINSLGETTAGRAVCDWFSKQSKK